MSIPIAQGRDRLNTNTIMSVYGMTKLASPTIVGPMRRTHRGTAAEDTQRQGTARKSVIRTQRQGTARKSVIRIQRVKVST